MSALSLYDFIGIAGVCCSLYGYARVQWHRDFAKQLSYSILNFTAAVLLLFSLLHHWNLASVIGNCTWGVISLYGIYRCVKYIRRDRQGL